MQASVGTNSGMPNLNATYYGKRKQPMAAASEMGKGHSKAHPGFKAVQGKIAKKYGSKAAGAILASATRKASAGAKKANPRLKRVKGKA